MFEVRNHMGAARAWGPSQDVRKPKVPVAVLGHTTPAATPEQAATAAEREVIAWKQQRRSLEKEGLIDEYFSLGSRWQYEDKSGEWPTSFRWIACYAVTGGSEGHYIHVDLKGVKIGGADADNRDWNMFLGKTFQGMDHAQKIAARCAHLLGA